jgi:hypothetical protein
MSIQEAVEAARYSVNAEGEKTEVLLPLATWTKLLSAMRQMIDLIEDREDAEILRDWLTQRSAGSHATITLDQLEAELRADGFLSS